MPSPLLEPLRVGAHTWANRAVMPGPASGCLRRWGGTPVSDEFRARLLSAFPGPIIGAGAYDVAKAERLLGAGWVDAVAFGRAFIANPDLPERIRQGGPFNEPDQATFYGGGAEGYVDYPALGASA